MILVPPYVPEAFISMYLPAIYAGLIVGFIGSMAIALKREEIHILILTDLIGLAMIFVVSAVGTDLAEALILPGLVVELAETLAISEILLTREMRKIEQNPRRNDLLPNALYMLFSKPDQNLLLAHHSLPYTHVALKTVNYILIQSG